MSLNHASQTGADNIHEFAVRSESDPGAIGAGKGWLKLSTGELKARNATDDGWVTVGSGAGLSDHLADTTDAHDASAVSFVPAGTIAATNVQAAVEEVATEAGAGGTGLSDHLADTTDAHDATAISYAGSTNLSSTNVETALDELDSEKASATSVSDHLADTTDAHDASAISFAPAGTVAATNVQAAIEEVATEGGSGGGSTLTKVYADQNVSHTNLNSSTYTTILFSTTNEVDALSEFVPGTGIFTAASAKRVHVTAQVAFQSNTAGARVVSFFKNGTQTRWLLVGMPVTTGTITVYSLNADIDLASGDTLDVRAYLPGATSGSTATDASWTNIAIHEVLAIG